MSRYSTSTSGGPARTWLEHLGGGSSSKAIAVVIAILAMLGLLPGPGAQMAAGDGPAGATLDIADPTADVVDPLAGVAPVRMVCAPGAVDINHTTVAELMERFGLSRPVAGRVLEHQSYLKVRDLAVVEGFGFLRLAGIIAVGKACATPPTTPPPDDWACTGAGRLDVHLATADDIARRLKVGKPVADRVVGGRPYASPAHLARISGVGEGRLDEIAAVTCLTPWPIATATTEWRWGTNTGGGVSSRGKYQLAVPPGVITEVGGAWLSVKPMLDVAGNRAEYDIAGAWDGVVAVSLPTVPAADMPETWTADVVLHDPDAWDLVWLDESTHTSAGQITVPTTTLSPYGTYKMEVTSAATVQGEATRPYGMTQEEFLEAIGVTMYERIPAPTPGPIAGCADDGQLLTAGVIPAGQIDCRHAVIDGTGLWTFTNDTGDWAGGFIGAGAVASVRLSGSATFVAGTPGQSNFYEGRVGASNRSVLAGAPGDYILAPRASITIAVPPGATGTATFNDAWGGTLNHFGMSQVDLVLELAGKAGGVPAGAVEKCYVGIGASVINVESVEFRSFADCALDSVEDLSKSSVGSTPAWKKAGKAAKVAGRILLALDAIEVTNSLAGFDGSYIEMKHRRPQPRPLVGSMWGPGCIGPSTDSLSWVTDAACQQRYIDSLKDFTGGPTAPDVDGDGCWTYDMLAGAWVLDADAGQGCLLLNEGWTFCGVGSCPQWPDASGKILELTDGRSFYVDAQAGAWHLTSVEAWVSCGGQDNVYRNPEYSSGRWYETSINTFTYRGEIDHC